MRRLLDDRRIRRLAAALVVVGLVGAVVLQRQTMIEAVEQLSRLSLGVVAILIFLGIVDRYLRAELFRCLLPPLSLGRAELVSDIGAAASKGLPGGGPIGTVLRWQVASAAGVNPLVFVTMLIALGVSTAFVVWTLALVSTVVDTLGRQTDGLDLGIIGISSVVLVGSAVFWGFLLFTERPHRWLVDRSAWVLDRLSRLVPALEGTDPEPAVLGLRSQLRRWAKRPWPLLARSSLPYLNGALLLWIALLALGAGPVLGPTEYARVFFVGHLLGSFAPTPGGVGFIEVGLSAALVAAGVDGGTAVAAVAVYRLATFVAPIVVGTVLYVGWQRRPLEGKHLVDVGVLQGSHDGEEDPANA